MLSGWERLFGGLGAAFGLIAVGLGAFGAHALRNRLDARALEVFELGVRYQLVHALALLLVALLVARHPGTTVAAGWAFTGGIVVFSGSLYLLALTGVGRWGAVTPLGGIALLTGWALVLASFLRG